MPASAPQPNLQRRALIVHDGRATCDLIEKVLISVGIESVSLTNSSDAPGALRAGRFSVAFLDYHMASPDGPELTRRMRDSGFHRMTPIVLISDDPCPHDPPTLSFHNEPTPSCEPVLRLSKIHNPRAL